MFSFAFLFSTVRVCHTGSGHLVQLVDRTVTCLLVCSLETEALGGREVILDQARGFMLYQYC